MAGMERKHMSRESYVVRKIEMIEEELDQLKAFVAADKRKAVSLRGMWKGVDFPDGDVERAKQSLFNGMNLDDSD
jgi:hypothetical protein